MNDLSAHRALHLAAHAVPILKHLAMTKATMTYKEFGQALGLVQRTWKPMHEEQLVVVLDIVARTFDRLDAQPLEYHRLTKNGKSGHWYQKRWVWEH